MKLVEFIINLIDYGIHNLNMNCVESKNNYKLISFTSVQRLSSIYRNVENYERREEWERRITLIDMYPPQRIHLMNYLLFYITLIQKYLWRKEIDYPLEPGARTLKFIIFRDLLTLVNLRKLKKSLEIGIMIKELKMKTRCFFELKLDKNGFYAGINVEYPIEVAVFDDFRAGIMKPEEFINLIDYRVYNMNKGGSVKNNYKLMIFTSVQRLSSIYRNIKEFERREQWERRIELIDMYPPQRVHLGR